MSKDSVVVIGAGIVGMACAAHLQRAGRNVTVLDSRDPGNGCSYGNAGSISPDMVVPIALPGMLAKVPGWLLDPLGPLCISPRHALRALPWLVRWVAAGREARVRPASAALRALHQPVFAAYRELLGTEPYSSLIRTGGQLHVSRRTAQTRNEIVADQLRAAADVRVEVIGEDELRQMEPTLSRDFKRGLFFPDNGHTANPRRLVQAIAEQFVRAGGRIERRQVLGFEITCATVSAVRTAEGPVPASAIVIAAGAWSRPLASALGASVPLEAERGYHVTLPNPGIEVRNKLSDRDRMFGATMMEDGLRFAGTVEIASVDAPPVEARAKVLLKHAQAMFPGLRIDGHKTWMGCRPSTPDSLPVIDRAPGVRNAFFAFGHGHTGMTGAPVTGRLIADLVTGRSPQIDPSPYRATRFQLFERQADARDAA